MINTRILEKDYHVPKIPVVQGSAGMPAQYYLTGESICTGKCDPLPYSF
jgi:hypothetical protein